MSKQASEQMRAAERNVARNQSIAEKANERVVQTNKGMDKQTDEQVGRLSTYVPIPGCSEPIWAFLP